MNVLGIGCASPHDPSAALLVDGEVVAAAEQERFSRRKHALSQRPVEAARYCLAEAGLKPADVDVVAYPWSKEILRARRWEYARRVLSKSPHKALRAYTHPETRHRKRMRALHATLEALDIDPGAVETAFVEHHLAHASSAFHFSGFPSAAVLTLDGEGEITSALLGEGLPDGRIEKCKEILKTDSLGLFYAMMTEYLGFESMDGEYKVMGMAPYGDPGRCDLSGMVRITPDGIRCDDSRVWVPRKQRVARGKHYSRRLLQDLGPARTGDGLGEPYVHVAAATQKLLEDAALSLVQRFLSPALERHQGRLAYAGGVALNVRLNQKLMEHPGVRELYVQPAAHDAGLALGAAAYAAVARGEKIRPMTRVDLGPAYAPERVRETLERSGLPYERVERPEALAADLLARGEIVGWFQGRMEWGPRALGQRSILGNPTIRGTADEINRRIKFREPWRPFCPSVLAEQGPEVFDSAHDSPFMTFTFRVRPEWRERISEVVHVDGTARPQYVTRQRTPRFHALLEAFRARTGVPLLINTSLNRRGEPLVCSPEDALGMFRGSGLEFLLIEGCLVRKPRA